MHVKTGQVGLWIAASEGLTHPRLKFGSRAPLGGWVAPRYGEVVEAPRLEYGVRDHSAPVVAILWPDREGKGSVSVQAVSLPARGVAVRVTHGAEVDYVLLRAEAHGPPMEAWGIRFTGSLLWATSRAGTPVAISWLDGELADWGPHGIRLEARTRVSDVEVRAAGGRAHVRGAGTGAVVVTWRSARD